MKRYLQGIFAIAFRLCEDADDANDITQEVCIKIMKSLKTFRKESEFKTWIYRIAYNETLYFLRSKKEPIDIADIEFSLGENDVYEWDTVSLEKSVHEAIDQLPPIDKTIILLYYFDDLKIREIADIIDMNENTIKTRISRAKVFLQPLLETLWKHL